ncbi:MAG: effector-associated domain EAD1-containing protein [Candidatus Promineifilaceae bacterium]
MTEWNEIRRPFREALISGFNWNSLSLVLRYHCDRRLDRITAQSAGFDSNVDEVIEDAVRNGWLEKLAQGALDENERHSGLNATVPLILAGVEAEGKTFYQD